MPEVFISYARATLPQARMVMTALETDGFSVWSDDQLPPHRNYADVIEERLAAACAVVVIWSADAGLSQWVRSEANRGREDQKLIQVTVDGAALPMPFDQIHCADLTGWSGDPSDPEWRAVAAALADLVTQGDEPRADAPDRARNTLTSRTPAGGRPISVAASSSRDARLSIAVLPFRNANADPKLEYLADAIVEELVTVLSRWRWFLVIAHGTSARYKDKGLDARVVAAELGVRYLLEGSVRRSGARLRLSAQLIDANTGSSLWAEQYDRRLVDLPALQDEITEEVIAAIEPAMLLGEGARIAHRNLSNPSALDCFYRGMWQLNRLTKDADSLAETLFREAIRLDPDLSLAHVGLARVLYGAAIFGTTPDAHAALTEASEEAQTAIALDPRDAVAYFALAGAMLYLNEHSLALENAFRATTLNPNFAYGQLRLGQVLIFAGRAAEAISPIQRCLRLSPYDPQLTSSLETLALAYYQARDYEKAAATAELARDPRVPTGSKVFAASLARLGRMDEAAIEFAHASRVGLSPHRPMAATYIIPSQLEHLREGFRLARGPTST